jgi:hypothetical protein
MAMSGPQHAKTAIDLLKEAEETTDGAEKATKFADGQLHATLALLAATVHGGNLPDKEKRWWQNHGVQE